MISILLSTYNRAAYLPKAIDSVLAQTNPHWQLIISDDGSSDDTRTVLEPYLKDPRIQYLFHENVKLPRSRNLGAKLAHGDYFAILDSDDWYGPDHLAQNLAFLKQGTLDLCYSRVIMHGDEKFAWVPDKFDLSRTIHIQDSCVAGTLFFKREVFEALGGFAPVDYAEDRDFFDRAVAHGFRCERSPHQSYHYSFGTPDGMVMQLREKIKTV